MPRRFRSWCWLPGLFAVPTRHAGCERHTVQALHRGQVLACTQYHLQRLPCRLCVERPSVDLHGVHAWTCVCRRCSVFCVCSWTVRVVCTRMAGSYGLNECFGGRYSASHGAVECTLCAPGTYTNSTQSTSCAFCEPGSAVSWSGASECPRCRPGFFASAKGSLVCLGCLPGYISTKFGTVECTLWQRDSRCCQCSRLCGGGTGSQCPAGAFNPERNGTSCFACAWRLDGWCCVWLVCVCVLSSLRAYTHGRGLARGRFGRRVHERRRRVRGA